MKVSPAVLMFSFFATFCPGLEAAETGSIPSGPAVAIKDLLNSSDVALVGTISGVENTFEFFGYDKEGHLAPNPHPGFEGVGFPTVDYRIEIEQIISDPSSLVTQGEAIFRTYGDFSSPRFQQYDELLRGRSVFFLTLNPDKATYGVHHSRYIINIQSSAPRYINGLAFEDLLLLDDDSEVIEVMQSEDFVAEVVESVSNQSHPQ